MSVEIAVIGPQRPFVLETLERDFVVHKVFDAPDKAGVAVVTASSTSPALGPVALAYVHRDYSEAGTRLSLDGRVATVADLPLVAPPGEA
jgi:glycine cleavage system aminomethyltransferase T